MTEKRGRAHLRAEGQMKATGRLFYGWDMYSLLVLSIVLTGVIPLATATGIGVGFAVSQFLTPLWAFLAGLGCFLVMGLLQFALLFMFTRDRVRQWFIPWARRWFPPSQEVAKRSRS